MLNKDDCFFSKLVLPYNQSWFESAGPFFDVNDNESHPCSHHVAVYIEWLWIQNILQHYYCLCSVHSNMNMRIYQGDKLEVMLRTLAYFQGLLAFFKESHVYSGHLLSMLAFQYFVVKWKVTEIIPYKLQYFILREDIHTVYFECRHKIVSIHQKCVSILTLVRGKLTRWEVRHLLVIRIYLWRISFICTHTGVAKKKKSTFILLNGKTLEYTPDCASRFVPDHSGCVSTRKEVVSCACLQDYSWIWNKPKVVLMLNSARSSSKWTNLPATHQIEWNICKFTS